MPTIEELNTQVADLKGKYKAKMDTVTVTGTASLTAAETTELDGWEAEIKRLEGEIGTVANNQNAAKAEVEKRNAALAKMLADTPGNSSVRTQTSNDVIRRSITKGGTEVGDVEVVNDVVRVYNTESPFFAAHTAKQMRLTGTTYTYPKVVPGGAGYAKTEGVAGTADTASTITMVTAPFKTYSSQIVTVSQEMLDDAGFDVASEVTQMGMSKSTQAFDTDAVTALGTFGTPATTPTTAWAVSDMSALLLDSASQPLRREVHRERGDCYGTG